MAITIPPSHPRAQSMRRLFLGVMTASFIFLFPWIGYLSVSLPAQYKVHQWDIAWVGFDCLLVVAVGITAWCAWRKRQLFIPWAIITGTLLTCDAWFDIVMDWNTPGLWFSVLTAAVGELPLAALLFFAARRLFRINLDLAWALTGHTGPTPKVSRIGLLATAAWLYEFNATAAAPDDAAPAAADSSDANGRTGIDAASRTRDGVPQRVDAQA
ncbi:hypothetical protein ACIP5Y_43655 [Nocardia sp. NPDC088792]|uniref:hypothetical protein n=1 Tax=Nocardia sp. NPDC088792 TaxID=3364332 RepID=UPI0037FCB6B4